MLKWLAEGGGGIERLCAAKIRECAVILDLERFENQSIARVARGLQLEAPPEFTAEWIDERLSEAIEDLLRKDAERLEQGHRDGIPMCDASAFLTQGLGLDPDEAHARIVAYNAMPRTNRRAFFAIAVDNIELEELVGTEWKTMAELREAMIVALETILDKSRDFKGDDEPQ